jgi:hypothetical protein
VRGDSELAPRLALDEVFSLEPYTRHVDTVFERLNTLVRTKEEEPTYA